MVSERVQLGVMCGEQWAENLLYRRHERLSAVYGLFGTYIATILIRVVCVAYLMPFWPLSVEMSASQTEAYGQDGTC